MIFINRLRGRVGRDFPDVRHGGPRGDRRQRIGCRQRGDKADIQQPAAVAERRARIVVPTGLLRR